MAKGAGTSLLDARPYAHMLRIGSKCLNSDPWTSAAVLVVQDDEILTCPNGHPALLLRLSVASEDLLQGPES